MQRTWPLSKQLSSASCGVAVGHRSMTESSYTRIQIYTLHARGGQICSIYACCSVRSLDNDRGVGGTSKSTTLSPIIDACMVRTTTNSVDGWREAQCLLFQSPASVRRQPRNDAFQRHSIATLSNISPAVGLSINLRVQAPRHYSNTRPPTGSVVKSTGDNSS